MTPKTAPLNVIHLSLEINVSLTPEAYWGSAADVPAEVTVDTLLANLQGQGPLTTLIRDWNLDDSLVMTVEFPGGTLTVDRNCRELHRTVTPPPSASPDQLTLPGTADEVPRG
jgi:hypothetical protein